MTHRNQAETPGQSREWRPPGALGLSQLPHWGRDVFQVGLSACPAPAPLRAFPFYLATAYLENAPKNMGDILRYIIDFAFESLVIYKCPHLACSRDDRWPLWQMTTLPTGPGAGRCCCPMRRGWLWGVTRG